MWVAIWGWTLCLVLPVHAVDPVFTPEILSDAAGNTADSASMITWAGWPATEGYLLSEPSRTSEGLSTYYSMVHGFIDAVFAKGFPDDVLGLVMTQNFTSFNTDVVSTNVTFFAGFACTIVVGLLFILIFPIVACCFCCCRCCGNCGGEMRQEPNDTENVRRKACLVVTLVISSTFILVASICLFVINGDMSTVINSIDGTVDDSINDVKVFTNNTVVEAKHVIGTNFNFTIDVIFRDIDNIDVLLGIPVRDEIKTETNISFALASAGTIVTEMDAVDSALTNVENTMTELTTSINALNESLANITTSMDDIFANCPACPVAGRPDYSSATVSIDMSQFPNDDMASARSSMDDAKNTNMTDEMQKAELEVDNIPETVKNDSNQAMTDMKSDIDSIRADLDDILSSIDDVNDEVQGGSETGSFTELVGNYTELAKTYGKYRSYGVLGLASIVLLVVVFAVFGLLLGLCGTTTVTIPYERGAMSNCGGRCLITSAAVILIFSTLMMLLTFVTFLVGAPFYELVCNPLTDLDRLEKMETLYSRVTVGEGKYAFGDIVYSNDTISLQLHQVLRDCKNNAAAFQAFQVESRFDVDELLNYTETVDIHSTVKNTTIDLSTVEIYSDELKKQLDDIKGAVNISFTDFYAELSNNITAVNLSALADDIDTYAETVPDNATAASFKDQADELRRIELQESFYVQGNRTALNASVTAMEEAVSDTPDLVDALDARLQFADDVITVNGSDIVKKLLVSYADRVVAVIDSYVNYTKDAVKTKLGVCRPVWNIYNTLVVHTFCYDVLDTFNGVWFSLGWALFFFMVSLIFSVKAAKYFRTMTKMPEDIAEDDKDFDYADHHFGEYKTHLDPISHQMPSRAKFVLSKHNKVRPYDIYW